MSTTILHETHFLELQEEKIHIRRMFQQKGKPIVFIHGSIENAKVFYSNSGKGLAPYLGANGFDCFVVDLPGRGASTPRIDKHSQHDLTFYIEKVIPSAIEFAKSQSQSTSVSLVAHSWGGVLILASIAIAHLNEVSSMVFFGTKRRISVKSFKKFVMVDLVWRFLGTRIGRRLGYYPAKEYKIGSDNETMNSFLQTDEWVQTKEWKYFKDNIDVRKALQQIHLPPLLSITGANDDVLGHPVDVKLLLDETGAHQVNQFVVAGKKNGFQKNYDHIDILTDPASSKEVFPLALEWLQRYFKT